MNSCDCCGQPKNYVCKRKRNYQKLVEVSRPAQVNEEPLIGSSSVIEYRVTSDMRHKPADIAGVRYVQNYSAMDPNDRMRWLTRRSQESNPWIGDGNYIEKRPDHLHHFGFTTFDLEGEQNNKIISKSPPSHDVQYQSILGRKSSNTREVGGKKEKCSALAATRNGVPYILHMPCAKYGPKEEPKSMNQKRNDDCLGKKIVVCLPCDNDKPKCCKKNPMPFENVRVFLPEDKPIFKPKPVVKDYMYRCESRELLGSKLLKYCECVKRNGLQDQCPRTPCLGRPACLEKPWPNCWPSGGCNGIDYSRVTGLQRFNPSLEYRRDNKKCYPPQEESPQLRVVIQECNI